ncbi:MAG: hypothetical protein C4537_00395 [Acholeplasma sp.]|jgi:S-DNA-T family DNA segregation ATPase FtsK/SpoIIIE|nr:MAG: hypothetical protein C4537_00395 [Acholeplasma sp.]
MYNQGRKFMHRRNINFEIECFKDVNNNHYVHPFYKPNHGHLFLSGDHTSMIDYILKNIIRNAVNGFHERELKMIIYSTSIKEHSYSGLIKYLKVPIIERSEELIEQLSKLKKMMMNRYKTFRQNKSRDIKSYNTKVLNSEITHRYMPCVLFVIHEMPSSNEYLETINGLVYDITQQSRAAGIHVILSTASAKDTMSPLLKYNFDGIITKIESIESSKILLSKELVQLAKDIEPGTLMLCGNSGHFRKYIITHNEFRVMLH